MDDVMLKRSLVGLTMAVTVEDIGIDGWAGTRFAAIDGVAGIDRVPPRAPLFIVAITD